jgi:hypothetical protein
MEDTLLTFDHRIWGETVSQFYGDGIAVGNVVADSTIEQRRIHQVIS